MNIIQKVPSNATQPVKPSLTAAFTLIEMSIVLAIIGLIIGGILTGQSLIDTATQRKLISQIQQYNVAVRTFQNKYGHLPGDIPPSLATQFGLTTLTGASAGTQYHGDDNGQIDLNSTDCGEEALFWRHLADAQLINWQYKNSGTTFNTSTDTFSGSFYSSNGNPAQAISLFYTSYGLCECLCNRFVVEQFSVERAKYFSGKFLPEFLPGNISGL